MALYASIYESPELGKLTLASDGEAITGLWMEGQKYFGGGHLEGEVCFEQLAIFESACHWLDRYFADDPLPISALSLRPHGTAFQQQVWRALAQIPYGELRTYTQIAQQVAQATGKDRCSARAVGTANGRNPISIILPCHRVIGANGSLTGYAGGIQRKLWLLQHEHVNTSALRIPTRGTAL